MNKFLLSIIIPCYNEAENLKEFYRRAKAVLAVYEYYLLFIDDGSTDGSLEILKNLAAADDRVRYVHLSRNFGHQNALKAGYDHARDADCVVCMDADIQHPPELIPQLIAQWQKGYKVVNTRRMDNGSEPVLKRLASKGFYSVINRISNLKLVPGGADFRLLDAQVVTQLSFFNENALFMRELVPWLGFKQCTVAFDVEERFGGNSKYSFKKQVSFSLRGLVSSSIAPLRAAIFIGLVIAGLSFAYGIYALYVHWFTVKALPGWTSVMAGILFVGGLQLLLMGIIGEYLGKTFLESRKRPLYIVEECSTGSLKQHNPVILREREKLDIDM